MRKELLYSVGSVVAYVCVALSFLIVGNGIARAGLLVLLWGLQFYCGYQQLILDKLRYDVWWTYGFQYLLYVSFLLYYPPLHAIGLFMGMGLCSILEFLIFASIRMRYRLPSGVLGFLLGAVCLAILTLVVRQAISQTVFYPALALIATICYHRVEVTYLYGDKRGSYWIYDSETFIKKMYDQADE